MSGNNSVLGGGGFHHVAINAADFDKSYRFYTEVMGMTEAHAWQGGSGRAVMLDAGEGAFLEVFEKPGWSGAFDGSIIHFALRTTKLDAVLELARAAGCEVTTEPKDLTIKGDPPYPVRIAFFKGPDGEVVELFQER